MGEPDAIGERDAFSLESEWRSFAVLPVNGVERKGVGSFLILSLFLYMYSVFIGIAVLTTSVTLTTLSVAYNVTIHKHAAHFGCKGTTNHSDGNDHTQTHTDYWGNRGLTCTARGSEPRVGT